jgi:hypothetical protein
MDDPLHGPEVLGRVAPLDLAVHRVLEEDRAENAVAGEARAGDDPGAHPVHEREHLGVSRVRLGWNPVLRESLRRASAALVECRDEARAEPHLVELLLVHGRAHIQP